MPNNAVAIATLTVRFSAAGTVTNSASISSPTSDPIAVNNSASLSTTVLASSDLAVSQTVLPGSVFASSNVTFTVTVTNRGPSSATGFVLNDTLPTGFSLISVQWNQGAWSVNEDQVILNGGAFASGASATATIIAQSHFDGTFSNRATVSCTTDFVSSNNTANAVVTVTENPTTPILRITRSSANVILSWSTNAANFFLQSKADFTTNTAWVDVTNTPVQVGNRWQVTNSISASPKFYRLRNSLTSLSAMKVGNNVVVSWPINAGQGVLKSTTNLVDSSVWTVVGGPGPTLVGNRYYVTNPASANPRFYRLYN
jgi:uncharacterized repeat protein (TIGR01451 family)